MTMQKIDFANIPLIGTLVARVANSPRIKRVPLAIQDGSMLWYRLRLVLIGTGFLKGLVPTQFFERWLGFFFGIDPIRLDSLLLRRDEFLLESLPFGIAALALSPTGVAAVIWFQSKNPLSDEKWRQPTHYDNPFRFGNPLVPFHFVIFLAGAMGVGSLTGSLWNGTVGVIEGFSGIFGAVALYVGLRLAMRLCKDKIELGTQAS